MHSKGRHALWPALSDQLAGAWVLHWTWSKAGALTQSQDGKSIMVSKWQQVLVAMVSLCSLGMAFGQAVLRSQLASMQ